MEFLILFIFGIIMMAVTRYKDKKLMRLDWGCVSKFLAFMVAYTFFRISLASFQTHIMGYQTISLSDQAMSIPVWTFFLVWIEDAAFVLSIYWIIKKFRKLYAIPLVVAISLYFGYGHLYQGLFAAIVVSIYPYFISYRYGKVYGFGTIMVCHVMYDFITFYTTMFMPFLV